MENINLNQKNFAKKKVLISIKQDVHDYGKELASQLGIDFSKLIETAIEHVVLIKDEKGDE